MSFQVPRLLPQFTSPTVLTRLGKRSLVLLIVLSVRITVHFFLPLASSSLYFTLLTLGTNTVSTFKAIPRLTLLEYSAIGLIAISALLRWW